MSVALAERLEDLMGPIVVKEVRQGLRAKVFGIFFGLLLTGCFVMALVAWSFGNLNDGGTSLGQGLLTAYLLSLGTVCYVVIPYTAFRSLSREREEETWVLLVLTGLGARSIARGKLLSAAAQAALYASACAPFVVFSYFLNGVSVPQVVVALLLVSAWAFFLICVGLGLGTQAETKLGRPVANFVVLGLLGLATIGAFVATVAFAQEGAQLLTEPGFVFACGGLVVFCVGGGLVVLEGAAAGLALETEAPSYGPRLALTFFILAGWVMGVVGTVTVGRSVEGPMIGSIVTSLVLVVAGFFAISERDGYSHVYRNAGWALPGAARSLRVVLLLLLGSTVVWWLFYEVSSGEHDKKEFRALLAGPAYVALYLSLGAFVGRATPLQKLREPLASRLGFLIVTMLGIVAPTLVVAFSDFGGEDAVLNVFNPLIGMVNFIDRIYSSKGGTLLALLMGTSLVCVALGVAAVQIKDGERHA